MPEILHRICRELACADHLLYGLSGRPVLFCKGAISEQPDRNWLLNDQGHGKLFLPAKKSIICKLYGVFLNYPSKIGGSEKDLRTGSIALSKLLRYNREKFLEGGAQ
ncbi:hypothetical protein [Paenibacillus sp. S150]|uniref:hypothetical protein n=1 Tax=Paenibacillus sp. S150 TaxID=2749826 RepID=UPI001C57F098|nr:hypothetical protein [Paenibacillus sp. S150]MBW4082622.1 hypothetical protein [Paenibacillus sp. S150]